MMSVQHFDNNSDADVLIATIKRDGCVVVDNAISAEELSQLTSDLDHHLDQVPDCQGDFYGYATKRMGLLFNKSNIFHKMALKESVLSVMDAFLLPSCSQYQINLTQAISIGQNEPQQIMHQDDPMFPFLHQGYEVMLNCMWAIDDFTDNNGATILVPGSHKWPREESLNLALDELPSDKIVKGTMRKGSVLIYLGSLFHCGGQNQTARRRCGAVISYSLGWLRQAENSYLGYSYEDLQRMPAKLRELVGYFVHQPNLGSVNGVDPKTFIKNQGKGKLFREFLPESAKPLVKKYREKKLKEQ